MYTLLLASTSPRRKQLLEEAGFKFTQLSVKVSELLNKNLMLENALVEVARSKAMACVETAKQLKSHNKIILSADTVVILENIILGKPKNKSEAQDFLRRMSGKTHTVKTSFCILELDSGREIVGVDTSFVTFRELSETEILEYVETGDPMDKAGAYGIQGMAQNFVVKVDGSRENVMGLPVGKIRKVFEENGWHVEKTNSNSG